MRAAYNNAKRGDQILANNLRVSQQHLIATEKTNSDLQIENESLRSSLSSHQEALKNISFKVSQAEGAMQHANTQFQQLAQGDEKREKSF